MHIQRQCSEFIIGCLIFPGGTEIFASVSLIHVEEKINDMTTKWKIDPAHSEVQFKVKHLMITTVTGYFRKFDLEVETEGDDFNTASKIEFTADVNSIDTNNEQRNTHLRSSDFFDAASHEQIRFVGKQYDGDGDEAKLVGDLTIRGVTKPMTVNVEFGGIVVDPYGQTKAGFTVKGKLNRKDFGLVWGAVTEAGQVVVSDEIKIHAEIQLVKIKTLEPSAENDRANTVSVSD
jgi:polyisoprenoid-binding protein YceI